MSRIGIDLSDCCNSLESSKKTDRRKKIEELQLLLEHSHTQGLLNKNSETKTGISWNSIFTSLHNCILKETESFCEEKTKNRGKVYPATDKALKASCGLLVTVVDKANSEQPLLPCHELFSCILQVCETAISDDSLIIVNSIVGETYVNVLNSALSCSKYWGEISFETWKGLRTLVLNLILKSSSEKVKANLLNIFNTILLQGGRLSPLIVKSKKLLSAFPEVLQNLVTNKYSNVDISCLYVCHTICIQFGKEFRLSIYSFIDKVLPFIIALNDHRTSDTFFKEIVAQVLIEMVGIRLTDKTWLQEASSILVFAEKELADVCRHKLPLPLLPKLVILAVKLVKQIHSERSGSEEFEDPSTKRRKITSCIGRILENIQLHKQCFWPWLSYLDYLLEKAPEVLDSIDAVPLFSYLSETLPATSDPVPLQFLTKSSIRLLNLCKTENVIVNEKYPQELILILWSTVIRCASTAPLVDIGLLLANQLIPDWVIQDSSKLLLDFFLDRKILVTSNSMLTLLHLVSTGAVKSSRVRISLLQLCLIGDDYSAETIFRLLTRTKFPLPVKIFHSEFSLTETEQFIAVTSFGSPLPSYEPSKIEDNLEKAVHEDREACDIFVKLLVDHLGNVNSLNRLLSFSKCLCELRYLLNKSNLSLSLRMEELFEKTFCELLPRVEEELKTCKSSDIRPLLQAICDFFTCIHEVNKVDKIDQIENIFYILMDLLNQLLEKSNPNFNGSQSKPSMTLLIPSDSLEREIDTIELLVVKTILSLIKPLPPDKLLQFYLKILSSCANYLTISRKSGFRVVVEFLEHIVSSRVITTVIIKDVLKLEFKILKRWFNCCYETLIILDLLHETALPTFQSDSSSEISPEIHHMFYQILSHFALHISQKKFGPQIINKFIRLLSRVIQIDEIGKELIEIPEGKQSPILYFITFLNHHFHEVRMKAAEFVPSLFSSELCLRKKSGHQIAFTCTIKAVNDLFIIKEGKTPEDVKEEGLNRLACTLLVLLGLISSSYLWRRKTLFHLFKIISSKNISPSIFRKIHNYLEKSLKIDNVMSFFEQNLDFVLWSWYAEYKDFQKFPFLFLNYEFLPAFLKEYKTIIVTILLENNDHSGFEVICKLVDCSGFDLAKACFSEMIACLLPKTNSPDKTQAMEIHSFIVKHIDPSSLKQLLSTETPKVLLSVFMKLNDMDHFKTLCNSSDLQLPSLTPLNMPLDGINSSLKYMQKTSPNPTENLFVLLCKEYPNHVQFIMHNLLSNISLASTTEIRFLCFLQYITFCEILAHELGNINKMAGFVIWHTTNALANLTNSDLMIPATIYFLRFIEFCIVKHSNYIDHMLEYIYPKISSLCNNTSEAGIFALRIKDLLVLKKASLPRITAYLPLEETLPSLEGEINNFIKKKFPEITDLNRLSMQISMRSDELGMLFNIMKESNWFSDDCSSSVIHQLLAKLVTLATSADIGIQTVAAKCLGEIGPKNLYTLALQPESKNAPLSFAEKILSLLLPLIVHQDSEISEAASTTVTELLTTKDGINAFGNLSSVEKAFLIPFLPLSSESIGSISKDFTPAKLNWASCIRVLGSNSEGWAMWSGGDHSTWIRRATSRLLESFNEGVLPLLSPLALKLTDMAEELLPYVINIILDFEEIEPDGLKIVQSNLSYFFKKHFDLRNSIDKIEDDSLIYVNRKSVQCMLSIINFSRLKYVKMPETERLKNIGILNVNLLHVAYAAQFCRAYFTSLLYAELWIESIRSELNSVSNKIPLDIVCKKFPDDGRVLLNLLWEDYKELGELDSIEGCVRLQLGESSARIRYFREMGLWQQLVAEAELAEDQEAMSHGLLMSGLFTSASHMNDCSREAAWRLSRWDTTKQLESEDFSSLHYSALMNALHLRDKENALIILDSARNLVLRELAHVSLEVASSVYSPLAKLQLINEVEKWCSGSGVPSELPDTDWQHVEPLLWQRGLLASSSQHWLRAARLAMNNSSHLIAQRFLKNAKAGEGDPKFLNEVRVEEAQAYWNSGNFETAKYILKHLLDSIDEPLLKAKCLLTYGTWMAETKSEGSKAIIESYFQQAAALLDSREDRLGAAECLAKFADSEYQRIHRYLNSPEYDMKKSYMDSCRRQLQGFNSSGKQTIDEMKSVKLYTVNIEVDEAEIKAHNKEYIAFLRLAVREYLYCLQFEKASSDKMFRFVSLWLANKNSALRKELDQQLNKVPSYRFLPVFPQLAVCISPEEEHFSRTLKKLLYRCAEDHPHHCLWYLLALANAEFDKGSVSDSPSLPRSVGATLLVNELEKNNKVGAITQTMQELAKAYISLANIELPKNSKIGDYKISKQEKLRKFRDVNHVTCATMNVPIKKDGNYSDIIGINYFEDIFTLVGGINHPKKVKCLCSDGKRRIELVKGNDDPRQDALMQQVFSVLNTLLQGDKETSKRKLSIRTYKVVPLTQKSGVIEWCQETETLGGYLMAAHGRHRPQDISAGECRNRLQGVVGREPTEKLRVYLQICAEFKPVMRHFFVERFPTPGVWYEKRLAYTKSVATNSMIGYVMGIGDRHVQNILIDKETAELIHIDFGISFELGKILPTPETVPFRLTRDVEDGMGITGVEGVFRRCCEETMRVLRKRSEPVLTTLEMLLYDPLCSWSVKPRSQQSQQSILDMSTEETNKLAERFLQRLKLKLEGREECDATSVEAQVRNLIHEAKDPKNLCRLYRGWQAFF